jgi:DNA-directed RNA polymerase specialized sigma subunit
MSCEEDILLLTECIAGLPSLERKVLALYYLENIPLVDIAAGLGLSEVRTCQILVGSIDLVRRRFRRSRRTPSPRNRQKIIPSQGGRLDGA